MVNPNSETAQFFYVWPSDGSLKIKFSRLFMLAVNKEYTSKEKCNTPILANHVRIYLTNIEAKMSSPGRLSKPSPTDPELAPDNHRLYFPEDQSSGPDGK
ncbi:hypothetical protein PIB30_019120 [Stylosanthes scabra]|uniref:Uncharacterized protein n=1 Tax=Stylosanthes scabra TaxID=79078 RepID=A0ABU6W808_9FABA|nr:hypothetical protein [Stylosanthes scabra]